jgi:hypothetical protein
MAFDLSMHSTGWAITKGMKPIESGIINLDTYGFKGVTFKDLRFSEFLCTYKEIVKELVSDKIKNYGIKYIFYELLNIEHKEILKVLMQIQAAAKIGIIDNYHQVFVLPVHNKAVKGFFGLPTKNKEIPKEVILTAKKWKQKPIKLMLINKLNEMFNLCFMPNEGDRADAFGLCMAGLMKLGRGDYEL